MLGDLGASGTHLLIERGGTILSHVYNIATTRDALPDLALETSGTLLAAREKVLATIAKDATTVWDLATGRPVALVGHDPVPETFKKGCDLLRPLRCCGADRRRATPGTRDDRGHRARLGFGTTRQTDRGCADDLPRTGVRPLFQP